MTGPRPRLSDETFVPVVAGMMAAGRSWPAIGRAVGMTDRGARHRAARLGLDVLAKPDARKAARRWPAATVAALAETANRDGMKRAAHAAGMAQWTLAQLLRRRGFRRLWVRA